MNVHHSPDRCAALALIHTLTLPQVAESKQLRLECDELRSAVAVARADIAAAEARAVGAQAELEDAQVCVCTLCS